MATHGRTEFVTLTSPPRFRLVFYAEPDGRLPVRDWLRVELTPDERRTVGAAMFRILQTLGVDVCRTAFGRQLGQGLFEFRLREDKLLVRIFCHAHGDRLILLLAGYHKGRDPSAKRQEREIALARARLRDWRSRT